MRGYWAGRGPERASRRVGATLRRPERSPGKRKGRILAYGAGTSPAVHSPKTQPPKLCFPDHAALVEHRRLPLRLLLGCSGACFAGSGCACAHRARRGGTRTRANRAFAGPPVDGRVAPGDGARLAHVLAEPGRIRIADHTHLEAARRTFRRADPMAAATHAAAGTSDQLWLRGRGPASDRRRRRSGFPERQDGHPECTRGLAGMQGNLHSRGRGPVADAAGRQQRGARSAVGGADRTHARRAASASRGLEYRRDRTRRRDRPRIDSAGRCCGSG